MWDVIALLAMFPGMLSGASRSACTPLGSSIGYWPRAWESVDTRPRDAMPAIGIRPATASLAAVLPPSSDHLLTYTLYRFEICVRDAAVFGRRGGLGQFSFENLPVFRFPVVTTPVGAFLAVSPATELLSGRVRRAVNA